MCMVFYITPVATKITMQSFFASVMVCVCEVAGVCS